MHRLAVLALLPLVVAVACSSKSSNGGADTGGTPDVVLIDGLAPDGTVADVPKHECETDADCASKGTGWACNCEFKCIQVPDRKTANGCTEDKNCGSEKYCEPCTKTCVTLLPACAPCTTDRQCYGMMSRCVGQITVAGVTTTLAQKICAPWCPTSTHECGSIGGAPPGAYACMDLQDDAKNGICVPAGGDCGVMPKPCTKDADCPDPAKQKCYTDRAVCGCRSTLDCNFGDACNPVSHQCAPGCDDDEQCTAGYVCEMSACQVACSGSLDAKNVTGCTADVPIAGKEWDCVDGHCKIPGMCASPEDCHEPETHCEKTTHMCEPGCEIDFDCKTTAQICDTATAKCVQKPCKEAWECGCGQICDYKTTGICVAAEGKYCQTCDQQQEDPCGDKDTLCVGFKDKDEKDLGSFCMPPCSTDPANPCPQGWQCQEIQDDKGQSMGKKCIRHCYQEVKGGCAIGGKPTTPDTGGETASTGE